MIIELNIDGVKYYDLGTDNPYHRADSHLHLVIRNNETTNKQSTKWITQKSMVYIKSHPVFKNYDIESIPDFDYSNKRNQK